MGHSRIGTLPATRRWKDVVRLIADGANVDKVADATLRAAERAFAWVQDDAGFREAANLLVQIGLAAGSKNPTAALAAIGMPLSETTSAAEVAVVLGETLDQRIAALRQRSDFGEKAANALISTVVEHIKGELPTLIPPTPSDVSAALKGAGREKGFGELARSFFGKVTAECLDYFLSKALATKLGDGQRFATNNQISEFMQAMRTHCGEASEITQDFAGEWFSKHRYEEGGTISRESAEGFAWYAMQKMRAELTARAKDNEN